MKMHIQQAFSIQYRGPNTKADRKSAYNNVQVGVGPQHREIGTQFQQTMQVGVGPNTEKFEKKFYKQCKFGNQS
ncbi:hypothetical protein SASK122_14810 [Staphylococcus argenteus]